MYDIKAARDVKSAPDDAISRRRPSQRVCIYIYTFVQLIFAGDKSVLFFFTVAGCAFLTYYSRDSAISAQNALHEKRTLPGVSVYNVLHCGSLPTFQPIIPE